MRRAIRFILAALPLLGAMTTPLAAQKVAVVEKRLGNGTGPYSCGARARQRSREAGSHVGRRVRFPVATSLTSHWIHRRCLNLKEKLLRFS